MNSAWETESLSTLETLYMAEPAKFLWHVQSTSLHLLGSVHMTHRPIALGSTVEHLVDSADALAFESDFRQPPRPELFQLPPGEQFSARVPPELFARARSLASVLGINRVALERLEVWAAALALMDLSLRRASFSLQGVDRLIMERAPGKALHFLERSVDAYDAFRSPPASEQVAGLTKVVDATSNVLDVARAMIDAYLANDPPALLPLLDLLALERPVLYGYLLDRRNALWLPKIIDLINDGNPTVVTVGVMHMVGPRSLPVLLAAKGFRCRHVVD